MKLVCFDCDSTLSGIEGIDELARRRGPEVFASVEAMTSDAMNGKIPVQSVFERRLELIRPTRSDVEAVAQGYLAAVEPAASDCIRRLRNDGWTPAIISAGFKQAIEPLAASLGIAIVEAVELFFDRDGGFGGFDRECPATRSGGKPEIVRRLRRRLNPSKVVAVGDGVSDLETKPDVDLFVGYGGYVARTRVQAESGAFIRSLAELPALLASL